MAEMVVIRLGELVSMPQPLRMQQAERIRDERRRAGSSELPLSTTTGGVLGTGVGTGACDDDDVITQLWGVDGRLCVPVVFGCLWLKQTRTRGRLVGRREKHILNIYNPPNFLRLTLKSTA